MQDGTYPSRDFATLGPSGLRPPFTGTYIINLFSSYSTGQVSDFLHHYTILQSLMFLLNSRYPLNSNSYSSFFSEVTKIICRVPLVFLIFMYLLIKVLILVLELVQLLF